MSYCALIGFRDGKPAKTVEFSNSWGGAARIWDALFNRYLKDPSGPEWESWLTSAKNLFRGLAKRRDLERFERAVHAATFDRAIIAREHFGQFATDLRKFADAYPVNKKACHLRSWADAIEKWDVEAVGFYATSVGENLWFGWDEEQDEAIPYDLNVRNDHFEVYEALAENDT